MPSISGTAYEVEQTQFDATVSLAQRVARMRVTGALTPEVLNKLRKYFRIKNIYHSNAIEGNSLNVGETRLVVEQGLTITGKPLKDQAEAKKTWFFRLDFRSGDSVARYLFFFGSPTSSMRRQADVTLHISREHPAGSFHYERLDAITAPNVPNIFEIGYKAADETFVVRGPSNTGRQEKVDSVCRKFVQEVVEKHFGS